MFDDSTNTHPVYSHHLVVQVTQTQAYSLIIGIFRLIAVTWMTKGQHPILQSSDQCRSYGHSSDAARVWSNTLNDFHHTCIP